MIVKIDYIRNFGIYKNFNWNNIQNFKSKNIIYAWNYSGKTTLSRVFSSLKEKKINNSYPNALMRITTDSGYYTSDTISGFPFKIIVFNSDYVKENLSWELNIQSNAIFFEVGDNAINDQKIKDLEKKIDSINGTDNIEGKKIKYVNQIEDFDLFENRLFTDEARTIQNEHFLSLIKFNKADLRNIKNSFSEPLQNYIIKENKDIRKVGQIIKLEAAKDKLDEVQAIFNINDLIYRANNILEEIPVKNNVIKILEENVQKYSWVKEGLGLHSSNTKCLFCDNLITEERINTLNKYFENQASKIRNKATSLIEEILNEINNIDLINFPLSTNDFNSGYQEEYIKVRKDIDKQLPKYKAQLKKVEKALSYKIDSKIYSKLEKINVYELENITQKFTSLNNLINENNSFTENFEIILYQEREKFKRHLVAGFLKRQGYFSKEKKATDAKKRIVTFEEKIAQYQKEIDRLNSQKLSHEEGCAQFNYFIQSFLSRDDIEIKVDSTSKKFNLLRENVPASNLSEGEKTAIAFSHFLVTLKSIEAKNELKDYIIFIDDPISSLDGNHIFQINSLLKEIFFNTISNPNQQSQVMWDINCKQLFISTHNFEFFNLLKQMPTRNGYRYSKKIDKTEESRYFIQRSINESSIVSLPNVYDSYSSEYHYLFNEIHEFNKDPNKSSSPKLLLLPNILRRFTEMYTLTKYPTDEEVDDRANEVFGKLKAKRILKPFHYFSHFNNIDRIGKQSELLADVEKSCAVLLECIEQDDNKHYKALIKAIS